MRLSLAIFSFGTSLAAAATNSSIICSNSVYQPFMSLAAYAPAESFCSRLYPIAPITSTITAPAITSTITANWTLSITFTGSPLTDTITVEPTTATTSLEAVTTTTTIDTTVTETAPPTTTFTTTTLTETSTEFTTETVTATTQAPQKRDATYPPLATSEPKPSKPKCHHKSKSSAPAVEAYTVTTNAPTTTTYPADTYSVVGNTTFTTYPVPGNATVTTVTTYPVGGNTTVTTYPVGGNATFTTYPAGTNATSTTTNSVASSSAPPVGDCASGDALCFLFSSLTKTAPAVISAACSCIETAKTTTVTTTPRATFISTPLASVTTTPTETSSVIPTVTETVTPSATASVTDTSTITETPTSTVTVTMATTTITTSTATTTVEPWCAASAGTSAGTNTCKCEYDLACETNFVASPVYSVAVANLAACQNMCDMYYNCLAYRFIEASSSCGLYTTRGAEVAAAGYAAAPRVRGTCSNSGCAAYD